LAQINTVGVELINLREQHVSAEDLDFMKTKIGSFEALFNKRAQKYKVLPENLKPATDKDFRALILSEYTFLKRPAAIIGEKVIVGNDPKSVDELKKCLS
jgi:arsenate reductase